MDYSKFTRTILDKVIAAMLVINNPEIAPAVRQRNQEILFETVGAAVYAKIYDMNAFDMQIANTIGDGIDNRFYGLAKVASASVATGTLGIDEYVKNFIDNTIGMAQRDAVRNARENGKRPTVTRTESADCCKWCRSKAGTYTDPDSSVFERHGGCDGKITTSGYGSRNGLLKNYVKPSDR